MIHSFNIIWIKDYNKQNKIISLNMHPVDIVMLTPIKESLKESKLKSSHPKPPPSIKSKILKIKFSDN